ncbi:translocation/assembly module TamB domain-containing protein [Sphingomonas sp. C3-2]|uniref:translocation/assembly module TamB domain-containing protein n=1 Tax=Sphingomonas sp. C3-2 TaxID=3062169 RepID=UPI00294B215F|nr:translocation/assembly module TamB domain-containing protein [Sphingomonas sp. C3-2]WOK36070.1 translocation/assembly module TamB domain-containing protein [Sphingomonas sp. C3-2]
MDGETTAPEQDLPERKPRRRWFGKGVAGLGGIALSVVLAILGLLLVLDTGPGHRLIVNRIESMAPESGLSIRIGRIDGSIYNKARIVDLRIYDAEGLLFDSPEVRLDWQPLAWLGNTLAIKQATAELATLHKKPKFNPSEKPGPILPGFDIRIGTLRIDRLRIEPALTGKRQTGRLAGNAIVRDGRARIDLAARVEGGGDALKFFLDAEPDRDRFDLDFDLSAPAGGVFARLLDSKSPVAARIAGDGRWSNWKGIGSFDVGRNRVIDLRLGVQKGTYALSGALAPSLVSKGMIARLTEPRIGVEGRGTLEKRRLDLVLKLRSRSVSVDAKGIVDLGRSAFDDFRVTTDLSRPAALFPNLGGQPARLQTVFDGPFKTARFEYLLTAPRVTVDKTGFEQLRATGKGRLSKAPVVVPLKLTARRVTGVGDVAGGILANLSVDGNLNVTTAAITGNGLRIRSDKLSSKATLFVDLKTGRYDITLAGQLNRYFIPGIGIVDVKADFSVVPGSGGKGTRIVGTAQAWVRRFDNDFLRNLAGGLPVITTGLERGADGVIYLRGLKITAPGIRLSGNGLRRRDGTFHFEGEGVQHQYGPVRLVLDGDIARPKLDLFLKRPMDALGLADVQLHLDPNAEGFAFNAEGGSTLGPFRGNGTIRIPSGRPVEIAVAGLNVSGTTARGLLRSVPGGFDGRLDLSGGGLTGKLAFAPVGGIQQIVADLDARRVSFTGPPPISVRRGTVKATLLLDPAGLGVSGSFDLRGFRRGNLALSSAVGTAELRGGRGQIKADVEGARGRAFDLQLAADVSPERIRIEGNGTLDRRPIKLDSPAVLTPIEGGWALEQTSLSFSGGAMTLAGQLSDRATLLNASVEKLPLAVLDIAWPDLGMGGVVSGQLSFRREGAARPTGSASLKVKGLSRAGLVLSSTPVDMAVNAVLDGEKAAARAVIANRGAVVGRAQARLAPLGGGDLVTELMNAPLFAQIRYAGPGETLWRMTGVEIFDLSGPVSIGADVTGRLAAPVIRGNVRTSKARLESAITGTLLTDLDARGRFDGSRLFVDEMTANAGQGGTVSARGSFNLAAAEGFGIDLAVDAQKAVLLNRDDLGATVTGPLTIRTDGRGGVIGGEVTLDRSRFVLGRATAAQAIPRLNVIELNRRGEVVERKKAAVPWRLDIKAKARNRLMVTGLGLDSEWSADLDIGGTVEGPSIVGRADLVRGGYEFAGKRFDLERGTIRFSGAVPADPTLDIVAESDVQGLSATIRVTGTGQKPDIAFTSVPAMPEDELLSRLLFGTSITNLSAPEALQLAAAVAALQGGDTGLNPINAVRRAAGLDRLRVLPADTTTGQGTSVAAGKYLTRRAYVELITDGQGYSATRAEYQITRWLSILGSISTLGRESVNIRVSKDY